MNMLANYDYLPTPIEAVGNGSIRYRFNIIKTTVIGMGEEERESYNCEEVIVFQPLSANKITEAVITAKWNKSYEQKLINEYNAAIMGLLPQEEADAKITNYKAFLTERALLKAQVDKDWAEYVK